MDENRCFTFLIQGTCRDSASAEPWSNRIFRTKFVVYPLPTIVSVNTWSISRKVKFYRRLLEEYALFGLIKKLRKSSSMVFSRVKVLC